MTFFLKRDIEFRKYFTDRKNLVYCNDIEGLIKEYKILYNANAPPPVVHSVVLLEKYCNLHHILEKLKYDEHNWSKCDDLKIMTILLSQQAGYTKFPFFLCLWDSQARDQHYVQKNGPVREKLTPENLIPANKVILPSVHIKLGLVKQFVKAMRATESRAFQYIFAKFPKLSETKIREDIFDGPQIRKLLKDSEFESRMMNLEKSTWRSFRKVTKNFLGNTKDPNYVLSKISKIWDIS